MDWVITNNSKSQPPLDFGSGGMSISALLCLQEENISFLELRVEHSGLNRIWNFSLVQRLQTSVTRLNVGILVFKNFNEMDGFFPASFSSTVKTGPSSKPCANDILRGLKK